MTDAAVDGLVEENLALVGYVVHEVLARVPGHVQRDDLVSAGHLALLMAARSFDPDRGVPFARFALRRLRGALIDELRAHDWAPRSVRSRSRGIDSCRETLSATLGRRPTETELAEYLGVDPAEIRDTEADVARARVLSIQAFADPEAVDAVGTGRVDGPEESLLAKERLGYLRDAVDNLGERLRAVVSGYYLEGRPMAELAAELGVSDSRISQLCTEGLSMLRIGMNAALAPELVPKPARPDGCVARRREEYVNAVAAARACLMDR